MRVGPGRAILIDTVAPAETLAPEVLNVALALILSRLGYVLLHGGSVAIRGSVAVVMGPPGAGKSSLALAMARKGIETISDEIVPLTFEDGVPLCPGGNPLIRVSPELLLPGEREPGSPTHGGKALLDLRKIGLRSSRGARPVGCFLFLGPRFVAGRDPFRLEPLSRADSLTRSIDNAYTRRVLTRARQRRQFRLLAGAVRLVPSYALSIREGIENVDAAADGIVAFLAGAKAGAVTPQPRHGVIAQLLSGHG